MGRLESWNPLNLDSNYTEANKENELGSPGLFFLYPCQGKIVDPKNILDVRYTYELRDRGLDSRSSVFDEMFFALRSHVFLDKGKGPIESGYEIVFLVPDRLVAEISDSDPSKITKFRKRIDEFKGIPKTINILIYSKSNTKAPVIILAGREKKLISIPSVVSTSGVSL